MALYEKTASELSELLGKKEISAVELAKDVFARTKAVEDKVQGYVTVAEEAALAQAEAVDRKRAAGDTLSITIAREGQMQTVNVTLGEKTASNS